MTAFERFRTLALLDADTLVTLDNSSRGRPPKRIKDRQRRGLFWAPQSPAPCEPTSGLQRIHDLSPGTHYWDRDRPQTCKKMVPPRRLRWVGNHSCAPRAPEKQLSRPEPAG